MSIEIEIEIKIEMEMYPRLAEGLHEAVASFP